MTGFQWIIEPAGEGLYFLRSCGNPTAAIGKFLYAILLDDPPGEKWRITRSVRESQDVYM
jgi:hypothetical protein